MRTQSLPLLFLLLVGMFIPAGADSAPGAATAANPGSIPALLFSTVLTNLSLAFAIVLMFVFGLYAYASLARFAPYHSWIYLYLVSLTGIVWAVFAAKSGGSTADAVFLFTTVVGVNLIVHVLRFDRIEIPIMGRQANSSVQST